jgi:arsenic resistance protein ArsH
MSHSATVTLHEIKHEHFQTPQPSFRTLAIPESEDDPKIREKYRPFLLNPQQAAEDWANRLELDTVLDMAEKDLKSTQKRLKVLVLYGSLRKRYGSVHPKRPKSPRLTLSQIVLEARSL